MSKKRNYDTLRADFLSPGAEYRPLPFVRMDGDMSDKIAISALLDEIKQAGYGGLSPIPVLNLERSKVKTTPALGSKAYWDAYAYLIKEAKARDLLIAYYDDADYPSGRYGNTVLEKHPEARAYMLYMREYPCTEGEMTRQKLVTDGFTMSVVAYELDTTEIIDLREEIMGDMIIWDTPDGNWNILQFICVQVPKTDFVDLLSYEASMCFVRMSYGAFCERFSEEIGKTVRMGWYDDMQYEAPNRRMWSPDFNRVFMEKYGYDPAPYYPVLFLDVRKEREYHVAHFMQCRAEMLANGFFRAVADCAKEKGLSVMGHLSESKTAAPSNLFGDAIMMHKYASGVGVDMIHAYMYGFNGLKLASSAAYNFGYDLVPCEIYTNYARFDSSILYKEAMNAFARGVNLLMPNVMQYSGDETKNHQLSLSNPKYREVLPRFTSFASRCQALLQGGEHVADIALLYPIESLHSKVFLYDQRETSFQFPPVLSFADYISNINSLLNYSGRDVTVLHPDVLCERGRVENGTLLLENEGKIARFRILVLPAARITTIAVLRLIKAFYDDGGKLLATSELPFQIMEDDPALQKEAEDILHALFGVRENAGNYLSDYEIRKNENGGVAILLRASMTDLDGTEYVEADRIERMLQRIDAPADIHFVNMPRIANSGILALNLIAFRNSGANIEGIRSGGVFNYIHKRHDGCDVYYVSNTTVKAYHDATLIHGAYKVEMWDPHTAEITYADAAYASVADEIYTVVDLALPSDRSVFLVCTPQETFPTTECERYAHVKDMYRAYAKKK